MAFKKKNKVRNVDNLKFSIDYLHKDMNNKFNSERKTLINLNNELQDCINKKKELEKNAYNDDLPDFELMNNIWEYENRIKTLEEEINKIENNEEEKKYVIKAGKLLTNYYKILEKEKEINELTENMNMNLYSNNIFNTLNSKTSELGSSTIKNKKRRNLMDYLTDPVLQNKQSNFSYNFETGETRMNPKNKNHYMSSKKKTKEEEEAINKILEFKKMENKDIIYDKYMKVIDPNYVNTKEEPFDSFYTCKECKGEMSINQSIGLLTCECGISEKIIIDSERQSHKEPPKEMTAFSYKRINHLNEILSQFQAKESTNIPDEIFDKILIEIKKKRLDINHLNIEVMKNILKKIEYSEYYEHIPYIINKINGKPPPVIDKRVEDIIRSLFLLAQHAFSICKPDDRNNFITYSYVLYKIFELLELDEYLDNFSFLKDDKKLFEQEQIWKNICKILKWEYIASIV